MSDLDELLFQLDFEPNPPFHANPGKSLKKNSSKKKCNELTKIHETLEEAKQDGQDAWRTNAGKARAEEIQRTYDALNYLLKDCDPMLHDIGYGKRKKRKSRRKKKQPKKKSGKRKSNGRKSK